AMKKRKAAAAKALENGGADAADGEEEEGGDGEEGTKYEAETDMGRKQATSTRQLRLREDTAKYLLNLDLDSAKYDPKTRSMVDNPNGSGTDEVTNALLAEEGFQRASGDAAEFEKATRYAWETQEKGGGGGGGAVHMQANPTEAQLTRKRKADTDLAQQTEKRRVLAAKYGAQDMVSKKPSAMAGVSSEVYVEYDDRGRVKGALERKEKSIYAEDVLVNNHASVWGSWWRGGQWGYACCHSTVKNSFCTGEEGREAVAEAEAVSHGQGLLLPAAVKPGDVEGEGGSADKNGDDEAMSRTAERPGKRDADESRRRVAELMAGVDEEEMERYRRQRVDKNDPMAGKLGQDELV
ncbi:mRNA splicing protein, partial [Teratosphaeriaceae sp. CCFEE 6253]